MHFCYALLFVRLELPLVLLAEHCVKRVCNLLDHLQGHVLLSEVFYRRDVVLHVLYRKLEFL